MNTQTEKKNRTREMRVIVDYLACECYTETLSALGVQVDESVAYRKEIKDAVLTGHIGTACKLIDKECRR